MTFRSVFLVGCALLVGCGDDKSEDTTPDAAITPDSPLADSPPAATDRCTTNITGTDAVALCAIPNTHSAQRVVVSTIQAPATHAAAAIVFGTDTAPTQITGVVDADQLRVLFYGGGPAGPGMTVAPVVELQYGAQTETISANATWITAGAQVCFDVHDGSATAAPSFALWVTGQNGASCDDATTLTAATAYGVRALFHGHVGALDKSKVWFRPAGGSAAGTPAVTLIDTAVLSDAQIAAAVACSTTFTASTDWQPLCTNAGGAARFVVMTGAASTANNNFFYTVIGQDAAPTGNPTPGDGKLIVTGGKSNTGSSWTYFRFGATGSTIPAEYATDANAALYTAGPSTVCYDLGATSTGNLRIVFWATGKGGADCATRSTLTLANALYDSTTDATTGAMWNAALATGKLNFVKASAAGASLTSVQVSSEAAVLP